MLLCLAYVLAMLVSVGGFSWCWWFIMLFSWVCFWNLVTFPFELVD